MRKYFLWFAPIFFILAGLGWLQQADIIWKVALILGFSAVAIGFGHVKVYYCCLCRITISGIFSACRQF
jgi:BASS family bile acid:Na+ symporter